MESGMPQDGTKTWNRKK